MSPIRLLIVEDEYAVARDLEYRLTELGYQVVGRADDGPAAIARAGDLAPDAILMDIHLLGRMDGIDAAIAIRRQRDVPVIFLTAFGEPSILEKAKQAEPYGYTLKPFEDRELRVAIEMGLAKHRVDRELKQANARLEGLRSVTSIAEAGGDGTRKGILVALRRMTDSEMAFYGEVSETGTTLTVHGPGGEPTEPRVIHLGGTSPWAEAVRRREPLVLNRWIGSPAELGGGTWGGHSPTRLLVVPRCQQDRVVALALVARRAGDYTAEDARQVAAWLDGIHSVLDRRRAEEALRREHHRNACIIEAAQAGTWDWNVQTGEVTFNDIWARFLGFTLEELAPVTIQTWETFCHPDDLKRSTALLEKHFAGELPYYDCECRMRHRDGHWIWVHDRGRLVERTPDGRPLRMLGSHTDVTRRHQEEEHLRESERRLATLMANLPGMSYRCANHPDWPMVFVSEGCTALCGHSTSEFMSGHPPLRRTDPPRGSRRRLGRRSGRLGEARALRVDLPDSIRRRPDQVGLGTRPRGVRRDRHAAFSRGIHHRHLGAEARRAGTGDCARQVPDAVRLAAARHHPCR